MKFGIYTLIIESFFKKELIDLSLIRLGMSSGWGNGYILLPTDHPFYEMNYDDISVYVHGGLTFSEMFKSEHFLEWIKNREIDGDVTMNNFEKFDNYWMIGFDTNHLNDNIYNCPKEYVMTETLLLRKQCLDNNIKGIKIYKSKYLRRDKLKKINKL